MITVQILINGEVLFARSAWNISSKDFPKDEPNAYKVDDGEVISHTPDRGCKELAKKLIDRISEE